MTHAEVVIAAAAEAFGIRGPDITSKSRSRTISHARQSAVWIMRTHLHSSFPEIARAVGYRDHTSAMDACDNVSALLESDARFALNLRAAETYVRLRLHL
jgi:chromosomal replication initiator protein